MSEIECGVIVLICSLENMRSKEVIDILTGERLGYIDDVEINLETSGVIALVIYGRERLFGLLGKEDDIVIPCREIEVIGNDVMLVKRSDESKLAGATNKRRFSLENLLK